MIINVFENWFEPTGIRLIPVRDGEEYGVFIKFGTSSQTRMVYDPARGSREMVCSVNDGFHIFNKTLDEVAEEINKQIEASISCKESAK